jgi:hypothetical protein
METYVLQLFTVIFLINTPDLVKNILFRARYKKRGIICCDIVFEKTACNTSKRDLPPWPQDDYEDMSLPWQRHYSVKLQHFPVQNQIFLLCSFKESVWGFWLKLTNTVIEFFDIIHRPFVFIWNSVSETGFCHRLQVEPTQLDTMDRASPYLRTPAPSRDLRYDLQSVVSLSWNKAPIRGLRSHFYYCHCGFVDVGRCLTRGRVCRLQLLLALASSVILESESRGTRDHISLSQIRDFPFRRLRLARLRWRYSTPPPHG